MAKLMKSLFLFVAVFLMGFLALAAPVNDAPVIKPVSDMSVEVGTSISRLIYVSDADYDKVTLIAKAMPKDAALVPYSSIPKEGVTIFKFSWTPKEASVYNVKLYAYDGAAYSSLEEFKVTVTAPVPPPVDTDSDGVADATDNCPNTANADQADADTDGVGDACEAPVVVDTDSDGVADATDNCPNAANADQVDTDSDSVGDVCDASTLSPEEQEYSDYEDLFSEYEDDYSDFKKRYNDALDDDDTRDINKYEGKLNDLYDDLNDLKDDVEDFINDLEDADNDANEDLIDDSDDLVDEIDSLIERIDSLLNPETVDTTSTTTSGSSTPAAQNQEPAVEVTYFGSSNSVTPAATVETAAVVEKSGLFSNLKYEMWLIGGIVVVLAVVIFLFALLLRK